MKSTGCRSRVFRNSRMHRLICNCLGSLITSNLCIELPVEDFNTWLSVQKLKVTYAGVELIDLKSGDPRWCLDFRDMSSPAIVLLTDAYGKKTVDHGGFVLCPLYGRKSKAFQAASGTTNSAIVSSLVLMISLMYFHQFILPWLHLKLERLKGDGS